MGGPETTVQTEVRSSGSIRVFLTVWFGQLVSAMGTNLTAFALGVFVFQRTGSVTQFAMVAVFTRVPAIVLSPFAGTLADRWDRRRVMMASDASAGLVVLLLALLVHQNQLELWHIYAAVAVIAMCGALRDPAYYASVSQLVPAEQHGRASGLVQSGENVALVAPPLLAGILVLAIGLPGILVIDVFAYAVGVTATLIVRFPPLERSSEEKSAGSSLWRDTVAGWKYVWKYQGLLFLFLIGAATSFTVGMTQILITPLVLSFESAAVLGGIFSIGGLAMFFGGVVMTAWGGPKRRVIGIFVFAFAQVPSLFVIGLRPNAVLITAGVVGLLFSIQLVRGCTAAIIRSHVPHTMQARVFALNRFVGWSTLPLSYVLAGPLSEAFGALADGASGVVGAGPGRGIGVLVLTLSVFYLLVVVASYLNPRTRNVEAELSGVQEGKQS